MATAQLQLMPNASFDYVLCVLSKYRRQGKVIAPALYGSSDAWCSLTGWGMALWGYNTEVIQYRLQDDEYWKRTSTFDID
jgi:hypothetical protein